MTGRYDGKARAKAAGSTPGGPANGGGRQPADKLGAPRSPQRGRRGGGAQGRAQRQIPQQRRSGSKRAQHARSKAPGAQPKKRRLKAANAPGAGAAGPRSPEGGEPGGTGDPRKEHSRPPREARATTPAGSPQRTKGEGKVPGGAAHHGGRSPHTGGSFGAGGWRSGSPVAAGCPPRSDPAQGQGPRGKRGREVGKKVPGKGEGRSPRGPGQHTEEVRGNCADSAGKPDSGAARGLNAH